MALLPRAYRPITSELHWPSGQYRSAFEPRSTRAANYFPITSAFEGALDGSAGCAGSRTGSGFEERGRRRLLHVSRQTGEDQFAGTLGPAARGQPMLRPVSPSDGKHGDLAHKAPIDWSVPSGGLSPQSTTLSTDVCWKSGKFAATNNARHGILTWTARGRCAVADLSILNCGPLIEGLERDLGVSLETIARAVDVDRRTVERWRANHSVPQGKTRERLGELVVLRDQLLRMFGSPEVAQEWLQASSRYLGGFTPEEALKAGRLDRVRADLEGLAAGVYL
jgi:hypothetical protein